MKLSHPIDRARARMRLFERQIADIEANIKEEDKKLFDIIIKCASVFGVLLLVKLGILMYLFMHI